MNFLSFIYEYGFAFSVYGSILSLVSIILVIINSFKTSKIIRKYKRLMRGIDNKNLEALLEQYLSSMQSALSKVNEIKDNQSNLFTRISKSLQGVGVVRYNPFEQVGSDLSFSVALLDAHSSGVVITCLSGRQSSSTYAKLITNSKSAHPLSAEEIEALKIAKASIDLQK